MHPPWSEIMKCALVCMVFLHVCSAQPSYYITVPSHLHTGIEATIAVHWFGNKNVIDVVVVILDGSTELVHGKGTFSNDSIGILKLPALPEVSSASPDYWLNISGSAQKTALFNQKVHLPHQKKDISMFIELDKPVYKPSQGVKIRAICLHSDLKPFHGHIDIYIKDPLENLVQKWEKRETYFGVVSQEFVLSDNPRFGTWTIEFNAMNFSHIKNFTVKEYVVPKFEVTVQTPSIYVMTKKENVTSTIIAKYSYGQPVNGNVTLTVTAAYQNHSVTINRAYEIYGSINLNLTYKRFLKFTEMFKIDSSVAAQDDVTNVKWLNAVHVNITATVTESLTGIAVSGQNVVTLINSEYVILNTDELLRPQLNYTFKIKILRTDGQPLTEEERSQNVSVQMSQSTDHTQLGNKTVTGKLNTTNWDFKQYAIPGTGVVQVQFTVWQSTTRITIQVQYKNTTHDIVKKFPFWQRTEAYIQIVELSSLIQVGIAFELYIESSEKLKEINYVVLSKGLVVAAGKRNTTLLTLTPARSWTPAATIDVYYVHKSGAVIIDTKTFSIRGALKNEVSLSWSRKLAKPSENVTLRISVAEPGSQIGLMVVENRPNIIRDKNTITADMVEHERKSYRQETRGYTLTDARSLKDPVHMEDIWSKYPDNIPRVEGRVPETWIWQELKISSGTSFDLQVTVPDRVTSWVASAFVLSTGLGLGLTREYSELHVFPTFYVSLNLPFSVKRGEDFILEVILFNYLEQTLEITVTLELSYSFDIMVASANSTASNYTAIPNQRIASVPSQSGTTILFAVRPKDLGEISFTVKATSSVASDAATKKVLVQPEGIQKFYSQTVLLEIAENANKTIPKSLSFTFPSDVVNGSEEAYITVFGDILGPSIDRLDSLIQMPYGCGEQNMISVCPNIFVLQYLNATGQIRPDIKEKAINSMKEGYQRELTYVRSDGSFSAFGESDSSGSTWLSAFVFRCFVHARPFIYVDENVLEKTFIWLLRYQNMNTSGFREPGSVMHTKLQDADNRSITLTAYILIALLEDDVYRHNYKVNISKSIAFLEQQFDEGISANYTLAVVAYALSLANSTNASLALDQLIGEAEITGGAMFWSSPAAGMVNYWQPRSSEIEIAAYALLSCYQQKRINEGIPIMNWLSKQRSQLGGYTSTQDTIIALQALSQFAAILSMSSTTLTVSVTWPGNLVPKVFHITSDNRLVLQSHKIGVIQPLVVNVSAEGSGLAVCQLNVAYNIKASPKPRSAPSTDAFSLTVMVQDNRNDLIRVTLLVCTSYIPSVYGTQSGMALMEVQYLSGFSLDQSRPIHNDLIKKVELQDGKVNLYFDSINEMAVCVSIPMLRDAKVSSTQDATVSIVDYYKPRTKVMKLYTSSVMKAISSCSFCGHNCDLCRSTISTGTAAGGGVGNHTGGGVGNHTGGPSNTAPDLASHIAMLYFTSWLFGAPVVGIILALL